MVTETKMVIKVDLQCCRCYKKIKKILCKFPQIRDQVYDEKNNTVTITVVCCSPEKIKQKICCKGGDIIKCIEIKPPQKPKPEEKPDPNPDTQKRDPNNPVTQKPDGPTPHEPKPEPPKKPELTKPEVTGCPPAPHAFVPVLIPIGCPRANPIGVCCRECSEGHPGGPCFGSPPGSPIGACCEECSEGRTGGPCFRGLGRQPPPCYEGYRRPVCDSWGGGGPGGYYPSRCDYFCEENPSSCTIM